MDTVRQNTGYGTRGYKHGNFVQQSPIQMAAGAYVDHLANINFFDDFLADTLSTDYWAAAVEADGTDQSTVAITEAAGGTVLLSLGSVANDFGNLATAKVFDTSNPGRIDVRVKATVDATHGIDNLVIGLSDAKTESNGNLCTNISTPAIVPADGVFFIYEKANGGDLWYYGSANDGTDTAVATTLAPTAAYQKLSIEWHTDLSADFFIDDVHLGSIADALQADQVLCLIIAATHVGGTGDPVVTVDYVSLNQER